jgi:hypothetical protein
MKKLCFRFFLLVALCGGAHSAAAADKKIVIIAGKISHGPGDHEFRAGSLLLQRCLNEQKGIHAEVYSNGWPTKVEGGKTVDDNSVFEGASAVLIYADGGGGHPAIQADHMKVLDGLAAKKVGLGFAHYGVEVPKGDPGAAMHRWVGGYYEHQFSVNPMWEPDFKTFPKHPITRGVKPFQVRDEWYFNMRWVPESKGVTPILVATPSDKVRQGPYVYPQGPYEHIVKDSGRAETMMWAYDRKDGGRGFGFTGGHRHVNWGDDNFRKAVLNALVWSAHGNVPRKGIPSTVDPEELKQNMDPKQKK